MKKGPAQIDEIRIKLVEHFLTYVLGSFRARMDPVIARGTGLQETEAFFEALCIGGSHPMLARWEELHSKHRPVPAAHMLQARQLVVDMCVALERVGCKGRRDARGFAVKELGRARLPLLDAVTTSAIEHWQRNVEPNKQAVANALKRCSTPKEVAAYFIHLIHLFCNPDTTAIPVLAD
jgi:hypothetical protein